MTRTLMVHLAFILDFFNPVRLKVNNLPTKMCSRTIKMFRKMKIEIIASSWSREIRDFSLFLFTCASFTKLNFVELLLSLCSAH